MPLSQNGFKAIFLAVDLFTGYIQLYPLKDRSTQSLIEAVDRTIIGPHGIPKFLRSDNESGMWNSKEFFEKLEIKINETLSGIKRHLVLNKNSTEMQLTTFLFFSFFPLVGYAQLNLQVARELSGEALSLAEVKGKCVAVAVFADWRWHVKWQVQCGQNPGTQSVWRVSAVGKSAAACDGGSVPEQGHSGFDGALY
jgi:hypothetical protein